MADVNPVDYTSLVGQVRSVIGDLTMTAPQFHDEDIQVALNNNGDDVRLAGADLLVRSAMAVSAGGSVQLLDLKIDTSAGAQALLDMAKYLREVGKEDQEEFSLFEINNCDNIFAAEKRFARRLFGRLGCYPC